MKIIRETNIDNVIFINVETRLPALKEFDTKVSSWKSKMGKRAEKEGFDLTESYSELGGLYPEFGQIDTVVTGVVVDNVLEVKTYNDQDEKTLLLKLNRDLDRAKKSNPKSVLFGHALLGFGLPYIFKRSLINGVIPSLMVDSSGLKRWEVGVLDLKEEWRSTGYSTATLNNIFECFGLQMFIENNVDYVAVTTKIMGLANVFLKLSHKNEIDNVTEIAVDEYQTLPLISRIAEEGYISDVDSNIILSKSSKMTIEEKEILITIIKSALAYRKSLLDAKFENKILAS